MDEFHKITSNELHKKFKDSYIYDLEMSEDLFILNIGDNNA